METVDISRTTLIKQLKMPRKLPDDRKLVIAAGYYLQREYDPQLLEAVERAFQMSIRQLQYYINGGQEPDFSEIYKGRCEWLRMYLEITRENEAPGIFHALAALATASAVFGRRYWIDMGFYEVFPQIAGIIVGPTGLRKGAAVSTALKLIANKEDDDNIIVIRDQFTPAAFIEAVKPGKNEAGASRERNVFVVSPELAVTLGKISYLEGLVPFLTRLLDHQGAEYRTKSGGKVRIPNLAFTFLGATTSKWIVDEMNTSVMSGGFTSRFLFAYCVATPRMVFRGTLDKTKLYYLGEVLDELLKRPIGPVELDDAAEEFLKQWYSAHKLVGAAHELAEGYDNRKMTHILRLALNFALLSRSTYVLVEHLLEAIEFLEYLEPGMFQLFALLSRSVVSADAEFIYNILRKSGGELRRSELMRTACEVLTIQRFNEAMQLLADTKRVRLEKTTVKATGGDSVLDEDRGV